MEETEDLLPSEPPAETLQRDQETGVSSGSSRVERGEGEGSPAEKRKREDSPDDGSDSDQDSLRLELAEEDEESPEKKQRLPPYLRQECSVIVID